jgi:transcriptional regulator with XRE-family HTH domain
MMSHRRLLLRSVRESNSFLPMVPAQSIRLPEADRLDVYEAAAMPRTKQAIDIQVGARVRFKRRLLGMNQTQLARHLGISFQQVQKYERGTNRIMSGRLHRMATLFDVPITYFFDGRNDEGQDETFGISDRDGVGFVDTLECHALSRHFSRISDAQVRRAVISLIETLGTTDIQPDAFTAESGRAMI